MTPSVRPGTLATSRLILFTISLASVLTGVGCSNAVDAPRPSAPPATSGSAAEVAAGSSPASVATTELAPVRLPDLTPLAGSVQRQLRDQHAALLSAIDSPATPATERARLYGTLGHLLLAATFFDEALLCYRHAEGADPSDVRWVYYSAHAYVKAGDRANAATAFERVLARRPDYVPAMIWLADMYLDTGRADRAQATYARALTMQPDSAAAHFGAGRAALARGDHKDAITHLEQALRVDPQASAIHYPLAMAYRATGDRARATALVQRRGSRPPALDDPLLNAADVTLESAVSHEGLGMQALRNQDWRQAVESFRTALALAPGDVSLRYWLATALLVSGDAAGAEREFRSVVRAQPDFARAHFSLGVIHERRREFADARREFEATVQHAPSLPEGRLRLGDTLRTLGQQTAALPHYEAAVALDPGLADAWIGGAQALIALGRGNAASDWLLRARRVHPDRAELADLAQQLAPR